jgi:hypothetical protein
MNSERFFNPMRTVDIEALVWRHSTRFNSRSVSYIDLVQAVDFQVTGFKLPTWKTSLALREAGQ